MKYPGLSGAAVLTLAVGIGTNALMFSIVNTVLLRPLPYPDPDQLVVLRRTPPEGRLENLSPADFRDLRQQSRSFSGLTAYTISSVSLSGTDEPERLSGAFVSADWFRLLGRKPVMGRSFSPLDDRPGAEPIVIISHGLWQRRFGGDPKAVGKPVRINGESRTVIGVMPSHFTPMADEDLWMPLVFTADDMVDRGQNFLRVIARLRPRVSLAHAQAEMDTIAARLTYAFPHARSGIRVLTLHTWIVGDSQQALLMLFGAVTFLMLLVCANIVHLELAWALARQREVSILAALGASRGRLVRERITRSLLLAAAGGALGLLLVMVGGPILLKVSAAILPRLTEIEIDGWVLAFTLALSIVTGIICGLLPALQATRVDLQSTLKEGSGRATAGTRHKRLRGVLMISEVALAMVLLVGAGLMIKSFSQLLRVDPGFQPERALALRVVLHEETPPEVLTIFSRRVIERLQAIPSVRTVGMVTNVPLTTSRLAVDLWIEGRPDPPQDAVPGADYDTITPDYFTAMGTPLVRGRFFTEQDAASAPRVAIINQTLAKRYWPGADPIGKRISFDGNQGPWFSVVGVVKDIKRLDLKSEVSPQVYVPFYQDPLFFMTFVIRTDGDPLAIAQSARRAVWAIEPDQAIAWVRSLKEVVADSVAEPRFSMSLLAFFAAIALLLAMVGIYGVMAYSVNERTQEIGIRIVMGASRLDVLRLVVGGGLTLALYGLAIGLFASIALARVLASFLFGVSATDPLTYAVISVLLVIVAFTATYIPARQAAGVSPNVVLKA